MNKLTVQSHLTHERRRVYPKARSFDCDGCPLLGFTLCRTIREEAPRVGRGIGIRRYDRGKFLFEEDETPGFLGVLRRGYARQERVRLNGDHVLFGIACPGDIVGGLPGMPASYSSEAATDIEVCTIDQAAVVHLMRESPRFRQVILREANRLHERLLGSAWRLNALDSRERITAFLVDATAFMPTEPMPDGSLILHVEISRRDWADLTNTAVETISRTMRYLAEKDMVITLTPSKFRIRDLKRLAFLAGIDPPEKPWLASSGPVPPKNPCASSEAARHMIAVNASISGGCRIGTIQNAISAQRRGEEKRRRQNVEEEIRN